MQKSLRNIGSGLALLLGSAVASSCGQSPDNRDGVQISGESVALALESNGGHELVSVMLGDEGPYHFVIDTGSSVNVIDTQIASKLVLKVVGKETVNAPGGQPIDADVVVLNRLTSGDLALNNAHYIVLDIDNMTEGLMQGVLGMANFRHFLLMFEPARGRVVVSRSSLKAGDPGVLNYDDADGQIKIQLDVGGLQVPAHIDTGSPAGFTFPAELVGSLPLKSAPVAGADARLVGGSRSTQMATLDGTVKVGEVAFDDPQVAFMNPMGHNANIGNDVLRNFVLVLDQSNRTVALRHPSRPQLTAGSSSGKRRLGLRLRGMSGEGLREVASVDDGSLAAKAGIAAGDTLVSANGRPTQDYSMRELAKLFGGSAALRFEVQRDDKIQMLEVP